MRQRSRSAISSFKLRAHAAFAETRIGVGISVQATRLQSTKLSANPEEIYTKISDSADPKRNQFFQYTWGSWLENDKLKKSHRETRFSIEGVSNLVQELNLTRKDPANVDSSGEPLLQIKPVQQLKDGSFVLTNNLSNKLIGEAQDKDAKLLVKSIASIHEGKHHRIYKLTLSTGKDLVLRIPYKLESDYSISQKIKSEVATLDFLSLKLGLNVPKVVAYGDNRSNALQTPFILMEYIEGDLLMKKWNPLAADSEETDASLKSVIQPISDFQDKILSVNFNKFGSLYFHDDVSVLDQADVPYDGEENPLLVNRWRIGPSIERQFAKNKNHLSEKIVKEFNGPWKADAPLSLITSVASIELENAKNRLGLAQADSASKVEDVEVLKKQIETFEHLQAIGSKLFNSKSKSIMNVEELFRPKLFVPDLDPLNVIESNDKSYFIDFEYSTIKPFILTSYPNFVAYHGAKVYNLEEDIPGFTEMDEVEKQQYEFMYYKTRNERLWELELNSRRHDLIAVASPHVKVLKSPYLQALELKTDKDYLYVEGAIVQLQAMWDAYVANELCGSSSSEFPVQYTEEFLDRHQTDLEEYQIETVSSPFAATGGWIPQDMFETLKEQGIIVETENGNYKVEAEKALEEEPEEK